MSQYELSKFVSMMSLCLTEGPDCCTSQIKGKYRVPGQVFNPGHCRWLSSTSVRYSSFDLHFGLSFLVHSFLFLSVAQYFLP